MGQAGDKNATITYDVSAAIQRSQLVLAQPGRGLERVESRKTVRGGLLKSSGLRVHLGYWVVWWL